MNKWTPLRSVPSRLRQSASSRIWVAAKPSDAPAFNDTAYRIERCHDKGRSIKAVDASSGLVLYCLREGGVVSEATFDKDVVDA
jgi:hypothetical protein